MTVRFHDATHDELIAAWQSAIEPFADLAESLTPEQWRADSVLPGWSNADIVAHVVGIERDLLGEPTPSSDLDWDALPHADDLFSRYTELAVAARRGVPQDQICAELRKTIAARREWLADDQGGLGDIVRGPGGWELPRGVVIRMRCFDIWVHDQDLRAAIDRPGDLGTDAAWVAAGQMLRGLGRTWARDAKAPVGARAELFVTGPGVEFAAAVVVDADGRGRLTEPLAASANAATGEAASPRDTEAPGTADVTLRMSWPSYAQLSTGRELVEPVEPAGDPELAERLLTHFNVAP